MSLGWVRCEFGQRVRPHLGVQFSDGLDHRSCKVGDFRRSTATTQVPMWYQFGKNRQTGMIGHYGQHRMTRVLLFTSPHP